MKTRILALGIVGIAVSSYAIVVKSFEKFPDWKDNLVQAGFICLFIISFAVCAYIVFNYFKRKRYNGIRTIRQYYLQRSSR